MKRLFLVIILCVLCTAVSPLQAHAGFLANYRARVEQKRDAADAVKQVRKIFELQDKYTNSYNYEELYKLYSKDFINSDGFDKKLYFSLIKDTWLTYPDITYDTQILSINISSNYAAVHTKEYAYAVADEENEYISATGELNSEAECIYHLRKENNKWIIHSENILEEHSALKFGDARFIKMELNVPSHVAAGNDYTAELKVEVPQDQIIIASIGKERIVQPVEKAEEKYRKLPPEQVIERIFTANTDNVNEYNIASVGVTVTEPLDDENVRVYMNGLAFLMTRINVVPENKFIKNEDSEIGKAE